MIAPELLHVLILLVLLLVVCAALTAGYTYRRLCLNNNSRPKSLLIAAAIFLGTLFLMVVLQRQFPFHAVNWFLVYLVVITTFTIVEYRSRKTKAIASNDNGLIN